MSITKNLKQNKEITCYTYNLRILNFRVYTNNSSSLFILDCYKVNNIIIQIYDTQWVHDICKISHDNHRSLFCAFIDNAYRLRGASAKWIMAYEHCTIELLLLCRALGMKLITCIHVRIIIIKIIFKQKMLSRLNLNKRTYSMCRLFN